MNGSVGILVDDVICVGVAGGGGKYERKCGERAAKWVEILTGLHC